MGYSKQSAYLRSKTVFFSLPYDTVEDVFQHCDEGTASINYGYLLTNQHALEAEFTQMFAVLKKQKDENKEVFWLYCYYSASLLETFYRAYSQPAKEATFAKFKQEIRDRLKNAPQPPESDAGFIQSLYDSFIGGFRNLINSPFHISRIRDYVAYTNLCRLYWAFCRMTMTQGLRLAQDFQILDKLDAILGTHTDINKIISVFEAPIGVINYFSVGFFLIRFIIDGGLLIKHTFFPSELEKANENRVEVSVHDEMPGPASLEGYRNTYIVIGSGIDTDIELYYIPKNGGPQRLTINNIVKENFWVAYHRGVNYTALDLILEQTGHVPEKTTAYDRFKYELYKRHGNFANDLVWATVNFLTNFNTVVGISGPVAGYLTAVFLTFDVCLILYKSNLAKQEYLVKKAQYLEELADYNNPEKFKHLNAEARLIHVNMLHSQLTELEINWRAKEATFYFVAAAAALLMMGFTAAILISSPVLVGASFLVCTLAVAMYLSSGSYSKYKEKSLYLEQAQLTDTNLAVAEKEFELARNEFIFAMVKNTVVPMVLILTFAICWPAAVILTALYLGAELYQAYDQHSGNVEVKQLEEESNLFLAPAK